MAKNLPHCETSFGVYRSAQLTPHPFFLLHHLFSDHTLDQRWEGKIRFRLIYLLFLWKYLHDKSEYLE
jgi:hypothetical protein